MNFDNGVFVFFLQYLFFFSINKSADEAKNATKIQMECARFVCLYFIYSVVCYDWFSFVRYCCCCCFEYFIGNNAQHNTSASTNWHIVSIIEWCSSKIHSTNRLKYNDHIQTTLDIYLCYVCVRGCMCECVFVYVRVFVAFI